MYSNDDLLPTLPLPTLEETFSRLYESSRPFDSRLERAAADGVPDGPAVLQEKELFVRDCCASLVDAQAVLEKRSQERANWLGDWWDEFAYLRSRYPVSINTNTMAARLLDIGGDALCSSGMWGIGELPEIKERIAVNDLARKKIHRLSDAIDRAVLCILESLHFRVLMMREAVEETIQPPKGILLCQQQFRNYYAMRVPRKGKDEILNPVSPGATEYAVIMFHGKMAFLHVANAGVEAARLNYDGIRAALRIIIDDICEEENKKASTALSAAELQNLRIKQSIGLLTCAGRDEAAAGFDLLRAVPNSKNAEYLDKLYTKTLTMVSIDDDTIVKTVSEALRVSGVENPENRWYDRASSQIVSSNGVSMYQGEHSPMDAIVCATTPVDIVSRFSEEVKDTGKALKKLNCSTPVQTLSHHEQFDISAEDANNPRAAVSKHIEFCRWNIPASVEVILVGAYQYHTSVASCCKIYAFHNSRFGKAALSKHRVHVDFLCQLSIQLAHCLDQYHESRRSGGKNSNAVDLNEFLRRHFVATYESASTRAFQQGRTETVRSATLEMRRLIEALIPHFVVSQTSSPNSSSRKTVQWFDHLRSAPQQLADLRNSVQRAQKKHLRLVKEASTGAGIDRHLMGLKIAQNAILQRTMPQALTSPQNAVTESKKENDDAVPTAVPHQLREAVQRSQNFQLLTSQMIGGTFLGGFAHVSPQGYGVCYYVQDESIRACVSSFQTPSAPSATKATTASSAANSTTTTDAKRFGGLFNFVMESIYCAIEAGVLSFGEERDTRKSRL
ncbi:choline/carnitine O-acetyltransferase, putative [Bodo saltans]|uniref:Choline/carnitine O-acetyltransferase, putative n=1 Tax=Bodo saltans TaxID=75058 RepID=A0A0S4J7D6_BODSA|nr:choline/carnitine O-acetyltransferase, putative [Bodo saltans]|eukprot:CUG87318.1 choline/carnitine O-acetyltransferase, putative [Bodo saltans]